MTSEGEHQKHPPLKRPTLGSYHRCEWAIYGTSCKKIEAFYEEIESALDPRFTIGYIDADHGDPLEGRQVQIAEKVFSSKAETVWNDFDDKLSPIHSDAVFINGNHFPASRQIVFIDSNKRDSLERRKDQLDNIDFIITEEKDQELYDFLKDKIGPKTKIFYQDDLAEVMRLIGDAIQASTPPLKALILAGGKSQRMGTDKSQVIYDGNQTQELRMAELCRSIGLDSHISKGATYDASSIQGFPVIKDRLTDMGPFGAIVSAFMHDPDAAWLVIACDLPFITESSLRELISQRYSSGIATAYKAKERPFPEPLITIYEPRAYARFLSFMSLGYSCPRKVIINSDVRVMSLDDESVIHNVNTPEEMQKAKDRLSEGHG